jgi:hypothetical protein
MVVLERLVQCYYAAKLAEAGWVITIETTASQFKAWFMLSSATLDPDLARFALDLVIFDPAEDKNPEHATPRALVEFKRDAWWIKEDITRTRRLLAKLKDQTAFGYMIACPAYFNRPEYPGKDIEEVKRLGLEFRLETPISRIFAQEIGNGKTL